ncbi:hypothetical protein ADL35_26640, partial [Streptomyces sp. NRRL WC-3753]
MQVQLAGTDRGLVVEFWVQGGPGVKAAAEAALRGSDEDVRRFLETGRDVAEAGDDRLDAVQMSGIGGPNLSKAADDALFGTVDELREFLTTGWKGPLEADQR